MENDTKELIVAAGAASGGCLLMIFLLALLVIGISAAIALAINVFRWLT